MHRTNGEFLVSVIVAHSLNLGVKSLISLCVLSVLWWGHYQGWCVLGRDMV